MMIEYTNPWTTLVCVLEIPHGELRYDPKQLPQYSVMLGGCLFIVLLAGGAGLPIALVCGIAIALLFPKLYMKLCLAGSVKSARRLYAEGRNVGTVGLASAFYHREWLAGRERSRHARDSVEGVERIAEGGAFRFHLHRRHPCLCGSPSSGLTAEISRLFSANLAPIASVAA